MKAIVHAVKRDAAAVRRVGYLANKQELVGDWIGNEVLFNADSLLFDHHGKGRQTRHFVISLERDCDISTERLAEVAERFMATFAPASAWLGAVDRNTRAVHLHLVVCNSDGERTLNFSPSILSKMQEMESWTGGILETGKRGAILAKLTTATQIKSMTYEQIRTAIETGTLTASRRNKNGLVTSVFFGGRHVRLSTVQRAAALSGRNPEHRQPDFSSLRVDPRLDGQPGDAHAPAGRRPRPGERTRQVGHSAAAKRRPKTDPGARPRRERPDVFLSGPQILSVASKPPLSAIPGMARNPQMGGRVL